MKNRNIFFKVGWALLILVGFSLRLPAQEVLVISSSEAAHYKSAAQVAALQVQSAGYSVRSLALSQLSVETLNANDTRAFITIGGEATSYIDQQAPVEIPLIYCLVSMPESLSLNHLRPISGISTNISANDQFTLIAEALPKVRTIGMLYHSQSPKSMQILEQAQEALPRGWRLHAIAIDKYSSASKAITALFKERVDLIWTIPDSAIYNRSSIRSLLLMSIRNRIPVFGFSTTMVRSGALFGVSIIPSEQGRQAASLLLEQLKSSHQESHSNPPRSPKFVIAINQAVSDQLRINVSSTVTQRAQLISMDHIR